MWRGGRLPTLVTVRNKNITKKLNPRTVKTPETANNPSPSMAPAALMTHRRQNKRLQGKTLTGP